MSDVHQLQEQWRVYSPFQRQLNVLYLNIWGFPGGSDSKEPACNVGDPGSVLGSERSLKKGIITPLFLPGESHGQRILADYCPWVHRESDMIERLTQLFKYKHNP